MARPSSKSTSISSFLDETLPPTNKYQQVDELDISAESRISNALNAEIPTVGSKENALKKDALVFAKLSGHSDPPWPARVAKLCWNNGKHVGYEVFFYGTYQVGEVLSNKVWKYNEVSIAKFAKPIIGSRRKKADFTRGLTEIKDCPDVAPSSGIPESTGQSESSGVPGSTSQIKSSGVPESTGQIKFSGVPKSTYSIDKIRIKRTAPDDTWHLHGQTNEYKPAGNKEKDEEVGRNGESSSVIAGIKKIGGKIKSPWILDKSDQKLARDTFMDNNEADDEKSCISEPSRQAIRRSKRTRKPPSWKGLEAENDELAPRKIDKTAGLKRFMLDKGVKSRAKSRKKTPGGLKFQGTMIADGNQGQTGQKEIKKASVVGSSLSRINSTKTQVFTSTPNSYSSSRKTCASSTQVSPTSQMGPHGKEHQQDRLPDMDNDSTANDETLQCSTPVARGKFNKPNTNPGTKMDCVIVKEERASEDPKDWSVAQTISAIMRMAPSIDPEDIKVLRENKIDGDVLMKLKLHHFQDFVAYGKMKMGPVVKLEHLVDQLKTKSQDFS